MLPPCELCPLPCSCHLGTCCLHVHVCHHIHPTYVHACLLTCHCVSCPLSSSSPLCPLLFAPKYNVAALQTLPHPLPLSFGHMLPTCALVSSHAPNVCARMPPRISLRVLSSFFIFPPPPLVVCSQMQCCHLANSALSPDIVLWAHVSYRCTGVITSTQIMCTHASSHVLACPVLSFHLPTSALGC